MPQQVTIKQHAFLVVNLGTPNTINKLAIKRYLSEFLMDRHVVDLNPLLWWPLLHGIIIPKRVNYIVKHYQTIAINQQSPLLYYSQSLVHKLACAQPDWQIELAMTYGEPSIFNALEKLRNFTKINVIFLYPHYSTTTTLAAKQKIESIAKKLGKQFNFNYLYDYADDSQYISALCQQVKLAVNQNPYIDTLVLSYHGIPLSYIEKREEPYVDRCQLTTHNLQTRLQDEGINLTIVSSYQSQFGKGEWTKPSTINTLTKLAQEGKKSVFVMCPGFAVDCIETLYEIEHENRAFFEMAGGKHLHYIPALNDTNLHVNMLQHIGQQLLLSAQTNHHK